MEGVIEGFVGSVLRAWRSAFRRGLLFSIGLTLFASVIPGCIIFENWSALLAIII